MPMYDYHCRECGAWLPDEWYQLASEAPRLRACPACGEAAEKMPCAPVMMLPWNERKPIDGFDNIFEGTKHAGQGFDGKNRAYYKSDKIQVDLGA